jgi:hypothetical protein
MGTPRFRRGNGVGMSRTDNGFNKGSLAGGSASQLDAREGQAGPVEMAERPVVP